MDALKIPAVEPLRSDRVTGDSNGLGPAEISLATQIKRAFAALGEALEYAHDLQASAWEFAVEIASLRRLKLSNADLRWLVVHGLVEHAVEITGSRDATRSFRHSEAHLFEKRSCFVLTPSGETLAQELRDHDADESPDHDADELHDELALARRPTRETVQAPRPRLPKWDRDRHELRIGAVVVKRFTIPSTNQEAILAAFEEMSWPQRIEDPLPPCDESSRKVRLHETINLLNRTQRRPLVQFQGDDSGRGIVWELCAGPANGLDT